MKSDKDLYRQLRVLPCEQLWTEEVARFNKASPKERMERVAVIRAVGVVFSATANGAQKTEARAWLRGLLKDPSEKIRRYATAAIPKLGSGPGEEAELLALLKTTTGVREKKSLGSALDKIGGAATLDAVIATPGLLPQTELKVKASVARRERPSAIRLDGTITNFDGLRVHLRCRKGLEDLVRDEVEAYIAGNGKFRVVGMGSRFVAISPTGPFSLSEIYALRCFATVGIVLGMVRSSNPAGSADELASIITSPLSQMLFTTLTEGSVRYRLEFISKGHQRAAVQLVANRAYELCPDLLNDAKSAPWSIDIHPTGQGSSVELRPRLSPDPRFFYREDDVAAASHPPLAACMARLAGRVKHEIVWDPFCGSGLELIESALLGGVERIIGTDTDRKAIAVAEANVASAGLKGVASNFAVRDFREYASVNGLGPGKVTLVVTNPPMGRRIRIPDMKGLFADFFDVTAEALQPGGRLVFPNPLRIEPANPTLQLQYREVVDLGGFDCRLEVYLKTS
jgi:23S rRNA G2445 N2-methylase RlmL